MELKPKTLDHAIREAFNFVDISRYKDKFSPSTLPFCPRRYVIYHHATEDIQACQSWGYSGEFYTQQGHVIHAVTQQHLGKAGLLFGDWKCCGLVLKNRKASKCLVCGKWPHYREYRIDKAMNGIGGFIDGVIPEYNAVLEIKSKSTRRIEEMTEPIWYEWSLQASVYATALNRMYGWNLDKIAMLYISRENPNVRKIFVVPAIKTTLDGQVQAHEFGKDCVRLKVLPEGICNNQKEGEEKYCIYTPICFRPDLAKKLNLSDGAAVKI
jgi:hypothetical protein